MEPETPNSNFQDQTPKTPPVQSTTLLVSLLLVTTILSLGLNAFQLFQIKTLQKTLKQNTVPATTSTPTSSEVAPVVEVVPSATPPVKGWTRHTFPKPLGISFYTPASYQVTPDPDANEPWSVNITSDDKMSISLCVGCQLTSGIEVCGLTMEKCDVLKKYQLGGDESYSINVLKNTKKFVDITGILYKSTDEDIPLRVITSDGSMPSANDLNTLNTILSSVTDP